LLLPLRMHAPAAIALATAGIALVACTGPSEPAVPGTAQIEMPVDLRVVLPEQGVRVGQGGVGWTVDVIARSSDARLLPARSAFAGGPPLARLGRNPNFPGLVALLSTTPAEEGIGGPQQNLAGLFQMVAESDLASSRQVQAIWWVSQARFAAEQDVVLTVFVVEGDAPDVVRDRNALKTLSNEIAVHFYVNGPRPTRAPTPPPRPTPSDPGPTALPPRTAVPSPTP
jgi:hypothetical protein